MTDKNECKIDINFRCKNCVSSNRGWVCDFPFEHNIELLNLLKEKIDAEAIGIYHKGEFFIDQAWIDKIFKEMMQPKKLDDVEPFFKGSKGVNP